MVDQEFENNMQANFFYIEKKARLVFSLYLDQHEKVGM